MPGMARDAGRQCAPGNCRFWPSRRRLCSSAALAAESGADVDRAVARGLQWLAGHQSRLGHWTAQGDQFATAMTALAGTAGLCEGSTTTQGKYAARDAQGRRLSLQPPQQANGLIGNPASDARYTYGHGFAMLFLSQVLGEEEDAERREELVKVLTQAVIFTSQPDHQRGLGLRRSHKDGSNFDEGSTTITQVQGLRGCRNAGIPVPKEIIDKAVKYIKKCTGPDGGVRYSLSAGGGGGGRAPITAAAVACLFNAGDYDSQFVPKLLNYCQKNLGDISNQGFGHWHYAHYYYSQVLYREGGKKWEAYRDKIFPRLVARRPATGRGTTHSSAPSTPRPST